MRKLSLVLYEDVRGCQREQLYKASYCHGYSSLRSVSTLLKPSWLGYESVVGGIAKNHETESKELRNAENTWKIVTIVIL